MDQSTAILVLIVAAVIGVVSLLAQIRLFSIDNTLKRILQNIEAGKKTTEPPTTSIYGLSTGGDVQKSQDAMWAGK